jgi:hypothetical protein
LFNFSGEPRSVCGADAVVDFQRLPEGVMGQRRRQGWPWRTSDFLQSAGFLQLAAYRAGKLQGAVVVGAGLLRIAPGHVHYIRYPLRRAPGARRNWRRAA